MDKSNKKITYNELENLNEEGVVSKQYLHFKVYKNSKYFGTIIKIDNDTIIVDASKNNRKIAAG